MSAPVVDGVPADQPGDASEAAPVNEDTTKVTAPNSWLGRTLRRYEVVVATVAMIVLTARVAGGGFIVDRVGELLPSDGVAAPIAAPYLLDEPVAAPAKPPEVTAFPPRPAGAGPMPTVPRSPSRVPVVDDVAQRSVFATLPAPGAPTSVGVSPEGEVWVGTDNGPGRGQDGRPVVVRLSADGRITREYRPADVERGITAVIASSSGPVYLLARSPAGVVVLDPATGVTERYATIPDVRPCLAPILVGDCDAGIVDQVPVPVAMAFDDSGRLFIADAGQGAIWRVPKGGGPAEQWLMDAAWSHPTRAAGPTGLAVDGAGNLVVAVQGTLTEEVGVVYVIPVADDGSAGAPTELARTGAGDLPTGIALGYSGSVYLSLSAIGQVLVLDSTGAEVSRIPSEATIDTPMGLAFLGTDLLVAAQAPGHPRRGQVIRLPVGEHGGTIHAP